MATLAQGQAIKLHLSASQTITVTPASNGRATVSANGPGNLSYPQKTIYSAETFGPYVADTVMSIAAVSGSLEYTDPYTLVPSYSLDASNNVTGLVGPGLSQHRLSTIGDRSNLLPTHLPIVSPERHSAMSNIVVGGLTCSYQSGGERGAGMIRIAAAGVVASTALRLPLPLSAEYGTRAKAAGRIHIRVRCSDWSQVQRIYVGIAQDGGSSNYHLLKVVESNITRVGATEVAQSAKWNNVWRTLIESSDKKTVVGTPAAWDRTTKYFQTDGIVFTVQTLGAVNIDIDRIYSPDWPVGFVSIIGDGSYKTFRDNVVSEFDKRGWKLGLSGNRVDGSTAGVTTYPTLADLAQHAASGHDVFMHGHYLSGSTPTAMTGSVTDAEAREILSAARGAIAGAITNARGLGWHQWLTNTGKYNGADMAGILKSLGVKAARGDCTDAEWGIDPWNAKTTTWATTPATETGTDCSGWSPNRGRYNHMYAEFWDGVPTTPEGRDIYADSGMARGLQYCATVGDGMYAYAHNVIAYDGTNPLVNDIGTLFWRDFLADLDAKVRAGTVLVLSPMQVHALTYGRSGDVYMRWDGEWVNRSDGSIAF